MCAHCGFVPRACQPYRPQTKGKVERPFRYIRANFFVARRFSDIGDMNRQLCHWLDKVAKITLAEVGKCSAALTRCGSLKKSRYRALSSAPASSLA